MLIVGRYYFLRVSQIPYFASVIFTTTYQHGAIGRYVNRVDLLGMALQSGVIIFIPDVPQFDVCIVTATGHSVIVARKYTKAIY